VRPDAPWCPSNIEFIRRINGLASIDDVRRIVFDASYLVLGLGDVYLGAPVATPLDPRRFAIGMGVLGLVMAAVNYAVATWTTGDTWLWYTTVGDTILSVVLVFAVLQFAQRRSLEAP
jgi:hypothetical protein